MIALGVSAFVLLISASLLDHLYQTKRQADFQLSLSAIRAPFQRAILDPNTWALSRSSDAMMKCFSGSIPASCLALNGMTPRDFKFYSGTQVLYDSTDPVAGFTEKGQSCTTFGSPGTCVLKPHLTWVAQCNLIPDPSCLSPLVFVNLSYQTAVGFNLTQVNLASYGFQISKATFPIKTANSCAGVIPLTCTPSQAAICENGVWVCEEFGL